LVVVFGLVFPPYLAEGYQAINNREVWVKDSTLEQMAQVNQYIETHHIRPPYVFLADQPRFPMAYSMLWQNTIRATIVPEALLDSYLYYGNLDSYLEPKPTAFRSPEAEATSDYWWQKLAQDQVLQHPERTTFILRDFNPDAFEDYLFRTSVDMIAPGVLVVHECSCELPSD
jgi:hypothetical protein